MTDARSSAIQYAHEHREQFLEDLKELVRIPSVSTDPEREQDVREAAEWVANRLRAIGMQNVQVIPTQRHPMVFGEYLGAPAGTPTVLIYGHYDVQPADPLDLWQTEAFEGVEQDGYLYGRGASDMKGQVVATIDAIEAIMQQGSLPVNVKFMVEGEEEVGSPSLKKFLKDHATLLKSDFAVNADTGMIAADVPTITYGLRGLAYFELRVYGPAHDLHSGLFGGVVRNPAVALCELVAGMHDASGRITLPGFYDSVQPLEPDEREALAQLPTGEGYYLKQTGATALWGEEGYSPIERVGARPTLDVNGLLSGFTGEGSKTVIPAWAMAKVSMRLVPDQDPQVVEQQLRRYLDEHVDNAIRWELTNLSGSPASITDRDLPAVKALYDALETVWGKQPVYRREGGSVPVTGDMEDILGIESVLTGFGLPEDNIHAPNEKLNLSVWYRGIDALIHFFYNLTDKG